MQHPKEKFISIFKGVVPAVAVVIAKLGTLRYGNADVAKENRKLNDSSELHYAWARVRCAAFLSATDVT